MQATTVNIPIPGHFRGSFRCPPVCLHCPGHLPLCGTSKADRTLLPDSLFNIDFEQLYGKAREIDLIVLSAEEARRRTLSRLTPPPDPMGLGRFTPKLPSAELDGRQEDPEGVWNLHYHGGGRWGRKGKGDGSGAGDGDKERAGERHGIIQQAEPPTQGLAPSTFLRIRFKNPSCSAVQ
ncbi:hypothetical protein IAU59_006246 [Kwoniella sp. CBS 9459]